MKRFFLLFLISILIFSSCKKDEMLVDSSAKLDFSTDSVLFDTVFRYAGSTTKLFRIYNRHSRPMTISKAYLAGGTSSNFMLNIDGVSTTANAPVLTDIEIMGGDSLYAFVQVHVTPSQNAPLLIKDSIIFETNGNTQDIKLTAIGQDVYLHRPDHFFNTGLGYSITSSFSGLDTVLPNDKPHLMFGYVVIDSDRKVIIQAGTKIYMHNKAVLWVYDKGTLEIKGSKGNEVVIQGDRLEPDYKELPGQWGKIWLSPGSKANIIDWAIIKNGSIGVQADTMASNTVPALRISNTIIKNMTAVALYGQGSFIRGVNCVFANCGQYVAALTIGGRYKFEHCTFANYWTDKRTTPSLVLNNYYLSSTNLIIIRSMDSAYFGNCILYGNLSEEIALDSSTYQANVFSYKFDHCILRTGLNTSNGLHYNTVYKNDPSFRDPSVNNYQLNSNSPAINNGSTSIIISSDLNNNPRPNITTPPFFPDIGAYEYYP